MNCGGTEKHCDERMAVGLGGKRRGRVSGIVRYWHLSCSMKLFLFLSDLFFFFAFALYFITGKKREEIGIDSCRE